MSAMKVQSGQLWKKNDSADIYLVTRVYTEALSTVVMLRKSGAESEPLIRVMADLSVPDGEKYGDLGINFRQMTATIMGTFAALA